MKSKRRTRWSEAEATAALEDQEGSGLSLQAFCQQRGWHPQRLYRWRRRLEATANPSAEPGRVAAPSFVRAEVSLPGLTPAWGSGSDAHFELVLCSGQRLCFSAEMDPAALVRTVQALEAGRC
jgi:hypothetical protein